MKQENKNKTVVCQSCRGEGGRMIDLENAYCVYGREWRVCIHCQGSGRLYKKTTYSPAPFGPTQPTT